MVLRTLLLLAAIAPLPARAGTVVVNLSTDEPDPEPGDGTPDVDLATEGLQVTLRSAIEFTNSSTGADEITFSLASPSLMPAELPEITDTLRIDGYMLTGIAKLQGRGLVIRSPGCAIANFAIDAAPVDALLSFEAIALTEVELTNSVLGFGVRSRGNVSLTGGIISSNVKGGVLSWEGSVGATGAVIESNGGPGIMSLRGVTMTAPLDDPMRIRANGGGLYTDGPVILGGDGTHEIAGNFGDGIRTINGVNASTGIQIVDNASFGVRSLLSINLGDTATVTGNGHGFFATIPNEIAMDPTFTVLMDDDVRGGGLLSAGGGIAGVELVASDNGGPGISSRSDVFFERVVVSRNDGHGIDSTGNIEITFARVEGNLGIGLFTSRIVDLFSHAIIENNTSAGIFSRSVFIHGNSPTEILGNGKGGRATTASYDDTLAVTFRPVRAMNEGVRVDRIFWAFDILVEDSGGDGVACDTFEITDGRIRRNGNAGLRAVRGGALTRTIICDNPGGDLIHFQPVALDTGSGACDREQRVAEEGCGCNAVPHGSGSILLLVLFFAPRRLRRRLLGHRSDQEAPEARPRR